MELNPNLLLPEGFLLVSALIMLLVDLVVPDRRKNGLFAAVSFVVIAVTMFLVASTVTLEPQRAFNGFVKKDAMVVISQVFILLCGLFSVLMSYSYIEKFPLKHKGEYYYTLLFAVLGGMLLVEANEFSTLFVSLEVMSISVYILIALFKGEERSLEAGLKYFIMGSVGAAVLVYGLAVLYGLSGTTLYSGVSDVVNEAEITPALLLSVILVAVAFLFKTGAVPFHGWVPDVYQGSAAPVTAFMSAAVKLAAFVAFLRLFLPLFSSIATEWTLAVLAVAVVTMFAGALMALNQDNVKRMLAYSAISHTGVVLAAFVTVPALASFTVLFYLFVYVFMTVAAFGIVSLLTSRGFKGEDVQDWKGLLKKSPFLSFCVVVIFMSLAGIPPFAGFWAKFYVLLALVREGFVLTALAVLLSSLLSLYIYLKPLVYVFMKEGSELEVSFSSTDYVVVGFTSLSILVLGIFPKLVAELSLLSVASFLRGLS
ncbi:NADH-quinone oxidoreductase subunit N [Phorcysia thermohydrogeniphila]|uniref:NADH-quinone oxidoreductase subunit N n=1 Tax=Phorcysia thermohydrogeniphila TaxID=936138 RepID=A0A4V2PDJ2_9BACT|nr:NADH-quinone oxidoreductase subunit N [Phorcysia thermohydrogeniphila]TCK05416.1 NADH dehydrogenase subunit N [Phorcysia thermohydrogeniphila]